MNVKDLYDHILKHMTAEEALMKLLEGGIMKYEAIKGNNMDENGTPLHPLMIIAMAAMEMGWSMVVKKGKDPDNEPMTGILVGTEEYIDSIDIKWKDSEGEVKLPEA